MRACKNPSVTHTHTYSDSVQKIRGAITRARRAGAAARNRAEPGFFFAAATLHHAAQRGSTQTTSVSRSQKEWPLTLSKIAVIDISISR